MINQGRGIIGGVQLDEHAGDLLGHVGEDVEVAVAEGVVEEHAIALGDGGWAADNVNDGDLLRVGTGDTVECGKLADTEGCDDCRDALDAGVSIGGICWDWVSYSCFREEWSDIPALSSLQLPTHLRPSFGI